MHSSTTFKVCRFKNNKVKTHGLEVIPDLNTNPKLQSPNFAKEWDSLDASSVLVQIVASITRVEGYILLLICANSSHNDSDILNTYFVGNSFSLRGEIFLSFSTK